MGVADDPPKAKLTGRQKCAIAGLMFLQIPSAAIFYPAATLIVLTGFGAPLSPILIRIGSMPYSFAMKRKAAWQAGPQALPTADEGRSGGRS